MLHDLQCESKKHQHLYSTLSYLTLPYPTNYPKTTLLSSPNFILPYPTLILTQPSTYLTLLYSTFTVCSTLHYAFLPYATNTSTLPYPSSILPCPKIFDVVLTHTVVQFFYIISICKSLCTGLPRLSLDFSHILNSNKTRFFDLVLMPQEIMLHFLAG